MLTASGRGCKGDEKTGYGEERKEWAGATVWFATAAAIGDVAEEEVAGLLACRWKPEEMAEIDLAEVEDSREVERSGVEAEG